MGGQTEKWQVESERRADEVSRALVRVGVMTHGQITRLLRIPATSAQRLTRRYGGRFEEQQTYSPKIRSAYSVAKRITALVRLTELARGEWARREGIDEPRARVKAESLGHALMTTEVLIRMRQDGLLYDRWDLRAPEGKGEGLHAWLTRREDEGYPEFRLGLFILPMKSTAMEDYKKSSILSGTLRRVLQNETVKQTLFLATREYYASFLRLLTTRENLVGQTNGFYLLPFESFMEHPGWYLESIVQRERIPKLSLVAEHYEGRQYNVGEDGVGPPYGTLVNNDDGYYEIADLWIDGNVSRARTWKDDVRGYQINGQVAVPHVYVYDDTMRESLNAVCRMRVTGRKDACKVQVEAWPYGVVTPKEWPQSWTESPQLVVYDAEAEAKAAAEFDEKYAEYEDRMADDTYWLEKQPSVPEVSKPQGVRDDVQKPERTARPGNRWSLLKKRR